MQISKQHTAREPDMITLRNHAPRSYIIWLSYHIIILQLDDVPGADFENSLYAFGQSEKW